jgi:hypothetical protein
MSTLRVDIPDEIRRDIEEFVEDNPEYEDELEYGDATSGKTEQFVREAILLYLSYNEAVDEKSASRRLSAEFEDAVEKGKAQIDRGQYVSLDEV